jgi:hypothetical protein
MGRALHVAQGCPAVLFSRWDGTQWNPLVNTAACIVPLQPGPLVLAAGDTMLFVRFFSDPVRYRADIGVRSQVTLADERTVTSNSVDVAVQ